MTGSYSKEAVELPVTRALEKLRNNDHDLLDINVNERSISHQLAVYLQEEFPGWNVDCEYNRDAEATKKLKINLGKTTEVDTVFPDIIVHHRLRDENLLVIEMKKSGGDTKNDVAKLKAFTGGKYKYRFGLLLIVSGERQPKLNWYQNGREMNRSTKSAESSPSYELCAAGIPTGGNLL